MADPVLSGLYGLRFDPLVWSDVAAALSIGLVVAGLIGLFVQLFRRLPRSNPAEARILAARALPDMDRAMVLCGVLKELTDQRAPGGTVWYERAVKVFNLDPTLAATLADLYRPGPAPDPEVLEGTLLELVRR